MLEEDRQLDEESTNPGQQSFEKLTAGLYMGDIARRIMRRQATLPIHRSPETWSISTNIMACQSDARSMHHTLTSRFSAPEETAPGILLLSAAHFEDGFFL